MTVRKFSGKRVSRELLGEMLEAAAHAPTNGNMQLYSVIITRDAERKRLLSPTHFNQPASVGADVLVTFCADFNRFVKWCYARDAQRVTLAQQYFTIAEQEGLGTCYLGTTAYNAPQIAEILELPKRVVPVITVALGYPDEGNLRSDRIPASGFIHDEVYCDYSDERIDEIFAEKEARDDSRQFIEENGKKTLAQVFTDVRYPKDSNDMFSGIYLDFIREQGFEM